jgi:transposase
MRSDVTTDGLHAGFWRSPMCWTGCPGRMRRIAAAWTVKRCGTGCIATMLKGIAGLTDAPRGGHPPALLSEQMAELRGLVLAGPDPARDGVVRGRCVDLCDQIAERFEVEVHERTVGKLLRRMGLSRVQPRPHNPKRDLDAQEAFKKTSPRL